MTVLAALVVGFGLGLVYFGGVWFTSRRLVLGQGSLGGVGLGWFARLTLAAVVLFALSQLGIAELLTGLGGMWLARGFLIARVNGAAHGS